MASLLAYGAFYHAVALATDSANKLYRLEVTGPEVSTQKLISPEALSSLAEQRFAFGKVRQFSISKAYAHDLAKSASVVVRVNSVKGQFTETLTFRRAMCVACYSQRITSDGLVDTRSIPHD